MKLRYRPDTEVVLHGLDFKIRAGEKVGIVGRTGAGKSTISNTLSRIVELFGGSIKIDGVDIAKLPLNSLREKITVIPQDPTLFTGSVKINLDPAGQFEDRHIEKLLEEAGLDEVLKRGGLKMAITEGGANLSSGEK